MWMPFSRRGSLKSRARSHVANDVFFKRLAYDTTSFWVRQMQNQLILAAAVAIIATAYQPALTQTEEVVSAIDDVEGLEKYITSLVNRHSKPPRIVSTDSQSFAIFKEPYNYREQTRVFDAFKYLRANRGEDLWPFLLKHVHDQQYACTLIENNNRSGEILSAENRTVGSLCVELIYLDLQNTYRNVLPRLDNERRLHPDLYHFYWIDMYPSLSLGQFFEGGYSNWIKNNSHLAMYQVQIAVCEWAIQKTPDLKGISDKKKEQFVSDLNARIGKLKETKKPLIEKATHDYVTAKTVNESVAESYRKTAMKRTGGK